MEGEFKPSKEVFLIKLLWLLGPVVFMVIVYFLPGRGLPPLFNGAITVLFGLASVNAVWLYGQTLKINGRGLVITDLFGQTHSYNWRLMQSPYLETSHRPFLPPRLAFTFKYHEGGEVKYQLSELSLADKEKAVRMIRNYMPEVMDFDLNHPNNSNDLTPKF